MDKNFEIGEQNKQEKKKRKKGLTSQKVKSLYTCTNTMVVHTHILWITKKKRASRQ